MISKEDIEKIEKFIDLRNRGYYADGAQVTELYNRVLNKRVNPTTCGSCIRQRINELEEAYKREIRLSEALKETEVDNTKEEENGGLSEAESQLTDVNKALTKEEMMKARMAKVRAAKKK